MMAYSLSLDSSFWRRTVLTSASVSFWIVSSSMISPLSTTGVVRSIGMTSPVSSSTKSSFQVLRTFAASFLPSFFWRFSGVASISSARPKMFIMSLSASKPIALSKVVTGSFFLRSMYAYMTLLMSVANSIQEPLNGIILAE